MALDVLLAAAGAQQRQLLVQLPDLLKKRLTVRPIGIGSDVDIAAQDLHRTAAYNATRADSGQAHSGSSPVSVSANGGG